MAVEKNIRVEDGKAARLGPTFGEEGSGFPNVFPSGNAEKLNCNEREREGVYFSLFSRRVSAQFRCSSVGSSRRFFPATRCCSSSPPRRLLSTPFGREERRQEKTRLVTLASLHPSLRHRVYLFIYLFFFSFLPPRAKNFPFREDVHDILFFQLLPFLLRATFAQFGEYFKNGFVVERFREGAIRSLAFQTRRICG